MERIVFLWAIFIPNFVNGDKFLILRGQESQVKSSFSFHVLFGFCSARGSVCFLWDFLVFALWCWVSLLRGISDTGLTGARSWKWWESGGIQEWLGTGERGRVESARQSNIIIPTLTFQRNNLGSRAQSTACAVVSHCTIAKTRGSQTPLSQHWLREESVMRMKSEQENSPTFHSSWSLAGWWGSRLQFQQAQSRWWPV